MFSTWERPSNGSCKCGNQTGTTTELGRTSPSAQEYSSGTPFCVGRGAGDRCFEPVFSGSRSAHPAVDFGGDEIHYRFSHQPSAEASSATAHFLVDGSAGIRPRGCGHVYGAHHRVLRHHFGGPLHSAHQSGIDETRGETGFNVLRRSALLRQVGTRTGARRGPSSNAASGRTADPGSDHHGEPGGGYFSIFKIAAACFGGLRGSGFPGRNPFRFHDLLVEFPADARPA